MFDIMYIYFVAIYYIAYASTIERTHIPPIKATGDPNPKNGNTHKMVNNKKIIDVKNKLEFLSSKK